MFERANAIFDGRFVELKYEKISKIIDKVKTIKNNNGDDDIPIWKNNKVDDKFAYLFQKITDESHLNIIDNKLEVFNSNYAKFNDD